MKSRIQGVAAQMATFNFYFGSSLALLILRHADNLSKSLQTKDMSAAEGQIVAAMKNSTLKSMRSDDGFDCFWQRVTAMAKDLDTPDPELPRRRKIPRRHDDGCAPDFPSTVKDHYTEPSILRLLTSSHAVSMTVLINRVTKCTRRSKCY